MLRALLASLFLAFAVAAAHSEAASANKERILHSRAFESVIWSVPLMNYKAIRDGYKAHRYLINLFFDELGPEFYDDRQWFTLNLPGTVETEFGYTYPTFSSMPPSWRQVDWQVLRSNSLRARNKVPRCRRTTPS
jgi:hypothetical protein